MVKYCHSNGKGIMAQISGNCAWFSEHLNSHYAVFI